MKNFTDPEIKIIGKVDYLDCLLEMQTYTASRTNLSRDQIWLVEHPSVYTLGLAVRSNYLANPFSQIPFIKSDRGGQVTFHGPGQIIAYLLIDLKRKGLFVREFVNLIEQAVIDCLATYNITSGRRLGAPGVYIAPSLIKNDVAKEYVGAKIASLGLKISRGCSYHGVSLNVNMNLQPFSQIDPCGFKNLRMIDMKTLGIKEDSFLVGRILIEKIQQRLRIRGV